MVTKSALFVRALAGRSFQGLVEMKLLAIFPTGWRGTLVREPWRESETRIITHFEVNFGSADLVKSDGF